MMMRKKVIRTMLLVALLIALLANPDFKYMNGETVTLEGGMGLRP